MTKNKNFKFYSLTIALVGFLFLSPWHSSSAATLYLSGASVQAISDQTFTLILGLNAQGQPINAAQGLVTFDNQKVSVVSISKSTSIFNLWTSEPAFSNAEGTINFEGGLPSPGYSGSGGTVLSLTFRARPTSTASSTNITITSGEILANDGVGTNVLTSLGRTIVTINPSSGPTSTNQPVVTPSSDRPQVTSVTHPSENNWYSNNNPTFSWALPQGVTGVSYLVTDTPTSNPGPSSDGIIDKISIPGISDGTNYFHVKFRRNGVWTEITHYQFNVDVVPPQTFTINSITTPGSSPEILFKADDSTSGLDHYEVKIDSGVWETIDLNQANKSYTPTFIKPGTQTVYVKAVDKAGNETIESISLDVASFATGSTIINRISNLFDSIIRILSGYGLFIILLIAAFGALILIYQHLGHGFDKLWHRMDNRRAIRKTEHKIDNKFVHLIDDMEEEIKFLEILAKRRSLGSEEKYLKSKLQQYLKSLKNGGR